MIDELKFLNQRYLCTALILSDVNKRYPWLRQRRMDTWRTSCILYSEPTWLSKRLFGKDGFFLDVLEGKNKVLGALSDVIGLTKCLEARLSNILT